MVTFYGPGSVPIFLDVHHTVPVVTIYVMVMAGVAHEPANLAGISMLTARMLRRGHRGASGDSFERKLAALGASLHISPDVYATTFRVQCAARNMHQVMRLMTDMLATPTFDENELANLVVEARGEIERSRESDEYLAHRVVRRAMYGDHPAGSSIWGSTSSLARIKAGDLAKFHANFYRPANLAIGIAGPCTEVEASFFNTQLSKALPQGDPPEFETNSIDLCKPQTIVVDRPGKQQVHVLIGAHVDVSTADRFSAVTLVNTALGGMSSSMLMEAVRENGQMSYVAHSEIGIERGGGVLLATTEPELSSLTRCLDLELHLLRSVREGIVDTRYIETARANMVHGLPFGVETARHRVSRRLTEYEHGLQEGFFDEADRDIGQEFDLSVVGSECFHATAFPVIALVGDADRIANMLGSEFELVSAGAVDA